MSQKKPRAVSALPDLTPRPPSPLLAAPQRDEDNPKNGPLGFILLALAFGIGLFAWYSETPKPQVVTPATAQATRKKLEGKVNSHIQLTNRRIEQEKEQMKIAAYAVPKVGEFVLPKDPSANPSFNLRADKNEMNAIRDLRRNDRQLSVSANDEIQSEMANQQQTSAMDSLARAEYVREFMANARRNGYEVQLSPDLQVIGVRQIRQGASTLGEGEAYR